MISISFRAFKLLFKWEAEAGKLYELEASLLYKISSRLDSDCIVRPCFKKQQNKVKWILKFYEYH